MTRASGAGTVAMDPALLHHPDCRPPRSPQPRQLEAAGELAHLVRHLLLGAAQRLIHRGDHEILEHLDVAAGERAGLDLQPHQLEAAVDGGAHHTATGGGLDRARGRLLLHALQTLLQVLRLLEQIADARNLAHSPSRRRGRRSRTSATSPPRISTAALTAGFCIAALVSSAVLARGGSTGAVPLLVSPTSTCTRSGRPKKRPASSSINARWSRRDR